jgi:3-methyladenine DNA glycosylase AlkD
MRKDLQSLKLIEDTKSEIIMRESIYSYIKRRVLEISSEEVRKSGQRFFKEEVNIAGVNSTDIGRLSKDLYKSLPNKEKMSVFSICEMLWRSNVLEESFIACSWAYNQRKFFVEEDFYRFENWIERYVNNWASCDTFCNHTMGAIIDMYPHFTGNLKEWCKSENRWKRRAAAVSLIVPAREGRFMDEAIQIADLLLTDEDDMVRKGYGWLLKVCSNKHQENVFNFVMKRKDIMPRTSLRYAIEKMPAHLKVQAMKR